MNEGLEDCGHMVPRGKNRPGKMQRRSRKGCKCTKCCDLREYSRKWASKKASRHKRTERTREWRARQDQVLYAFVRPFRNKSTRSLVSALCIGRATAINDRVLAYNSESRRERRTWNLDTDDLSVDDMVLVVCNDLTPAQLKAAECKFKSEVLLMGSTITTGHSEIFLDVDPYEAHKAAINAVRWTRESIARINQEKSEEKK